MTPNERTKFKEQAQSRALTLFSSEQAQRIESDHYVDGYAALYEPYVLYYDYQNNPVYERFERGCFDECDMSDIIMQYDHEGKVLARNSNGSLVVEADSTGLFFAADLSRTEAARNLYDEVKAGMVTKMSWRFRCGDYYIERTDGSKDITIVHTRIAKIYDVSVVSIPANDDTEINARDFVHGVMDEAARREAELEERKRKLRLRIKLEE